MQTAMAHPAKQPNLTLPLHHRRLVHRRRGACPELVLQYAYTPEDAKKPRGRPKQGAASAQPVEDEPVFKAQRVQVRVPLLLYHLMRGQSPPTALGDVNAIVCHDDHVNKRHTAGNAHAMPDVQQDAAGDAAEAPPAHLPTPTRCLSRSFISPMHLHASRQSDNARTGRKRKQIDGRRRRLALQTRYDLDID